MTNWRFLLHLIFIPVFFNFSSRQSFIKNDVLRAPAWAIWRAVFSSARIESKKGDKRATCADKRRFATRNGFTSVEMGKCSIQFWFPNWIKLTCSKLFCVLPLIFPCVSQSATVRWSIRTELSWARSKRQQDTLAACAKALYKKMSKIGFEKCVCQHRLLTYDFVS